MTDDNDMGRLVLAEVLKVGNVVACTGHPGSGKSHALVGIMETATQLNRIIPGHPGFVVLTNMQFMEKINGETWNEFQPGAEKVYKGRELKPGQRFHGYPPFCWYISTIFDWFRFMSEIENSRDPAIKGRHVLVALDEPQNYFSSYSYDRFEREIEKARMTFRKYRLVLLLSLPDRDKLPRAFRDDESMLSYDLYKSEDHVANYNRKYGTNYTVQEVTFVDKKGFEPDILENRLMNWNCPFDLVPEGGFLYDHEVSGDLDWGGVGDWKDDEKVKTGRAYRFSISHLNDRLKNKIRRFWPSIMADFFEEKALLEEKFRQMDEQDRLKGDAPPPVDLQAEARASLDELARSDMKPDEIYLWMEEKYPGVYKQTTVISQVSRIRTLKRKKEQASKVVVAEEMPRRNREKARA